MSHSGLSGEHSFFEEFGIQDYLENPALIQVLKLSEAKALSTSAGLARSERQAKRTLEKVTLLYRDELLQHEQTRGSANTSIALLTAQVSSMAEKVDEARRLSLIALCNAWIGSVLVAVGVNLVTGSSNTWLGVVFGLAGASLEVAAFFVSRKAPGTSSEGEGEAPN